MKNKKCSKGLFGEAVKQLRIVGIIGIVIYFVFALGVSVGNNIEMANNKYMAGLALEDRIFYITYDMISISLGLIPIVFTPILMLSAFHFVNKRTDSDFYFSLPVKKTRLYASFMGAVLFWAVMIMAVPAVTAGICGASLKYVSVDIKALMMGLLSTLAECIFVMGVFGIGISLTGTIGSNVIASIFVMVVPRAVISVFYLMINGGIDFSYQALDYETALSKTNALVYLVTQVDLEYSMYGNLSFVLPSSIWSIAEGALYILAGGFIFRKRKSETAGKTSSSPKLQNVFRMVLPFMFCLAGDCFLVGRSLVEDEYDKVMTIFVAEIMFVLAVLCYFIYELICTKKWKKTLQSAKMLPVLILLAVISFFLIKIPITVGNRYMPEKSAIKYVRIDAVEYYRFTDRIKLDSDEAKDIIVKAYERQNDENAVYPEMTSTIYVHIGDGLFGHRRQVYVTSNEGTKLMREMMNDAAYTCHTEVLPPKEAVDFNMDIDWTPDYHDDFKAVYTSLYNELSDKSRVVDAVLNMYNGNDLVTVWAETPEDDDSTDLQHGILYSTDSSYVIGSNYFPWTAKEKDRYADRLALSCATPETINMFQKLLDERFGKMTYEESWSECSRKNYNFFARYCLTGIDDKNYDEGINATAYNETEEFTKQIGDIIRKYDRYGDASAPNTLTVCISACRINKGEGNKTFIGVYNLTPEDAEKVRTRIKEQGYLFTESSYGVETGNATEESTEESGE